MPPTYSYVAYLDEAGDEGFRFLVNGNKGSSDWFVLSAVMTRVEHDATTVKLVDEVRTLLKKPPKKALHFRDMEHKQRLPYIDAISKARLRTISVLIHKPSLTQAALKGNGRLYFYACRLLLERVSWFCRDVTRTSGDGSALVVFSNRSSMSYDDFRAYLGRLFALGAENDVRIHWKSIKAEQIVTYQASDRKGLQIADAVASGLWCGLERNGYGFTEPRYAQMLKPVAYQRGERCRGYGLKFMPALPSIGDCLWLADYPT